MIERNLLECNSLEIEFKKGQWVRLNQRGIRVYSKGLRKSAVDWRKRIGEISRITATKEACIIWDGNTAPGESIPTRLLEIVYAVSS